jgi:phosphatidylinositol alpha-1,6-mannosyltransferase
MEDFRSTAGVFANSEATAELVKDSLDIDQICVTTPGVSEPDVASDVDATDLEIDLDLPDDACVVLSLCRLVERKGIAKVLRALSSQELRSTNFHYVIAGTGPQLTKLRRLAAELDLTDRVDFVGFVDEETKWKLYALADLFVMPNSELGGQDWEGFGIVFLEAAIMGTPVIAGKSGGAPEAVAHGETGYTVDPESQTELQERMLELIRNPDWRGEMGRAARKRAKGDFRWEETARKVAEYSKEPRMNY